VNIVVKVEERDASIITASIATYTIRYVQSTVGEVDNRSNDSRHSETHVHHVDHYDSPMIAA
jgi:hypothetical protein